MTTPLVVSASQLAERLPPVPAVPPPGPGAGDPWAAPRSIVLTGSTGFLGAFLLRELLDATGARVVCLVRAESPRAGVERVTGALRLYGLSDDLLGRVEVLPADLASPRLGLAPADHERLADEADAIVHNGAAVHWLATYDDLEQANVAGTQRMLELATEGRPKPLHHVSSIGVFAYSAGRTIDEERSIDHDELLAGGYVQTKWAAEKLVALAGDAGLPVRIYRPGTIVGSSATGHFSADSFLDRLIATSAALGVTPILAERIEMTPVDYTARALVALALEPDVPGRVLHLMHPDPPHRDELRGALAELGRGVEPLPYERWRDRLFASPGFDQSPLRPFRRFLAAVPGELLTTPRYSAERTAAALDRAGVRCPRIDADLLGRYLRRYAERGWLDQRGT